MFQKMMIRTSLLQAKKIQSQRRSRQVQEGNPEKKHLEVHYLKKMMTKNTPSKKMMLKIENTMEKLVQAKTMKKL
jgi:hypothetical protein